MKIRTFSLSLLTALAVWLSTAATAQAPRYIFYLIGDGMGNAVVNAAQTYLRHTAGPESSLNMLRMPVGGQIMTYSASTPVTDSAAAGTALATGRKTNNGMLGVTPDTVAVTSVASQLHDMGYGVALVTSVAPDDATPGAFYAHVPSRKMYTAIGRQFADSPFEFLAGASLRGLKDKQGADTGLEEYIAGRDIDVVYTPADAAASGSRRIILLEPSPQNASNIGYTIDRRDGQLTLPDLYRAGLGHMQRVSPDRFFMMIEGGNIDHALHANDAATAIAETVAFDGVVGEVMQFYAAHPDETLIVITADHDTGGLSLGNTTTHYKSYPERFTHTRVSKDTLSRIINDSRDSLTGWESARGLLGEYLGLYTAVVVDERGEEDLRRAYEQEFVHDSADDQENMYSSVGQFAAVAVDTLNRLNGIGWTTYDHTGNPVPVFAAGRGAAAFGQFLDNIQIPAVMMQIVTATTEEQ